MAGVKVDKLSYLPRLPCIMVTLSRNNCTAGRRCDFTDNVGPEFAVCVVSIDIVSRP